MSLLVLCRGAFVRRNFNSNWLAYMVEKVDSLPFPALVVYSSSGRGGGPLSTCPMRVKCPLWHGLT
jgi:hypothetical protein